jgi:hypothetical protein
MPNIDEWNRQADQLNWLAQHGMGGLGPLVNELPQWARGRVGGVVGGAGSAPGVGGAGTLQGAGPLPGTYNPASGGIPGTTDTGTSLANLLGAISGQVGNLAPIIGGITGAENQALRDQYPDQYFGTLDTVLGNVSRRATGDITDLLPQMQQGAAEYGVGAGISGSPNANSKLLRDLGLTSYGVQRQATQDLGAVQNLIPKVAPYSPNRLIPDIGQQLNLQALADMLRAAPVPEAAFQRNLALANQGLNRGFNAGTGPVGGFGFNAPSPSPRPAQVFNAPLPGGVASAPAAGPGWGMAWNPQGGFAQAGNVPADVLRQEGFGQMDFESPEWDQFFDLSIDEPFAAPQVAGGGDNFDWFDDEWFD